MEDYQKDITEDINWNAFWSMEPNVNKLWDVMINVILAHANKQSCSKNGSERIMSILL